MTAASSCTQSTTAPPPWERDTPAARTAEGCMRFAMKALWDDVATARAAGTSTLQYAVTGSLLRGLGVRRNKSPDAPAA